MIVVADSNIIISALITPKGVVAKILNDKKCPQLLAPNFLFLEINNHIDKIIELSPFEANELRREIRLLKKKIKIIDIDTIPKKYKSIAIDITADIDYDDFVFVALGQYKKSKLWTSDKKLIKGLKEKGYENIYITTTEIKSKLYK